MKAKLIHIAGNKKHKIVLFALSTCQWCRKTKNLLGDLDLDYSFVDVDLAEMDDKKEIVEEIKKYNSSISFPTIVIDDKDSIIGFDEDKIKEKLS